ncbi:MAG: cell division protein ZapA [Gammaproteobacteria bacterium]|jgi:cell division protein ZapA|nr:cell division protein ZapA [Gammaproteobacteria bacterium]MBT3488288.1 cell division protein ZapA [Gammaproteobacteria bacterium]MBT3717876.1 cell division protein ZapA [Gammaproteobacteria bacterium]MBT3843810.1 cell division protein ZapA [Gammaproteobacteria bacterium]MBT3893734.1 cell division protein ZapA [Gammaproteobacteria bacterium]
MSSSIPVSVTVLQKEYKIACPPEEHAALIESAALVDQKMREIQSQGKSIGQDRIAIMAAINLTYELLQSKSTREQAESLLSSRVNRLKDRVESALFNGRQLELE